MDNDTSIIMQEPNKVGRPELYAVLVQPYLDDVFEWVSQGNTEQSICKSLGIHRDTWHRYKQNYQELTDTITRGRQDAGALMLNKQYQKASGMTVTLNKQKVLKDGTVVDAKEDVFIPPDTNAAEFWARHLYPDYKAPKSVDSGQNITVNFQLDEAKQKMVQIVQEYKNLGTIDVTDFEVIDDE